MKKYLLGLGLLVCFGMMGCGPDNSAVPNPIPTDRPSQPAAAGTTPKAPAKNQGINSDQGVTQGSVD